MKHIRLDLFKLIKENESELDERVIKERKKIETLMFSILRILFSIIIIVNLLNFCDEQIMYKILFYSFYIVIWMEPLIFSKCGLWEKANEAKFLIGADCIVSLAGTMDILLKIAFPKDVITTALTITIGIFAVIVTYFIYAITYDNYIRKQDAE